MRTIQKVLNTLLTFIGIVFFLIYVILLGLVMFLGSAPIYTAVNFKEFMKNPLGFLKDMLLDIKAILGGIVHIKRGLKKEK